ncbi:MAG: TraR/DksA family transcriptional regulator [Acidimicrobiia bacterium]|nr:TraR/DksA family transcriptional regulator [Acidimicrobiia bacterium]MDH4307658.1 TraR/DksA family transcriptional regulator [Acidimicrobiia bacterium]MDH5294164.1 TraR/DksA family transcriptional regulator [Acidimicrobiia bacterium]
MAIDTASAKQSLIDERQRLVHQLEELGATESGDLRADVDYGDGFADAGAATAERTERLGLAETLKAQLDAVDAALARIEEGNYGVCASCGTEIPAARLEARPASILCVDCKTRH